MPDSSGADAPPFFASGAAAAYEQPPGTPYFLKRGGARLGDFLGDAAATSWREKQDAFIKWTRDRATYNEAVVGEYVACYKPFFEERWPHLRGRVLDIGGGWGLFRKWWHAGGDGCFVVHDPGVERFTVAPPVTLQRFFGDGLAKPALFVEGFGEELPYRDAAYDVVLIAAALDHCAAPPRVMAEARRVLRSGGRLLVIQAVAREPGQPRPPGTSLAARLVRVLSDPRRLYPAIRMRLVHRGEPHMHHFTRGELRQMVAAAGFAGYSETVVRSGVLAIEAHRAS